MKPNFIRLPDVKARTRLGRSTIYCLEKAGKFPARYELSPGAVAWLESDVDAWVLSRSLRQHPASLPLRVSQASAATVVDLGNVRAIGGAR